MTIKLTRRHLAASIAAVPIGDAVSTKSSPAAAAAGTVPRTHLDRFGDNVVAHDLSDGSGSATNDDDALAAAFAAAQAAGFNSQGFLRPVLLTRPFNVTSKHNVPAGMRIYSTTQNAALVAQVATGSMLNITGGRTRVEGLLFQNPNLLTVTPIAINKPHNDYTVGLKGLDFANFPIGIDWVQGDRPDFEDVFGVSVGLLMRFRADAQNGHIIRPKVLGGNLVSIARTTGATYQMEGTTFEAANAIQGPATFSGAAPSGPVVSITAGLAIRFPCLMIDQVTTGGAVRIDASAAGAAVEDITFLGAWAGGASAIAAGVPGVNYRGNVARCHWFGGKINGFSDFGWAISGRADGSANAHHNGFHGVEFRLNINGDVGSAYGNDNVLNFCELNSPSVSLYEIVSSQMMGVGNYFAKAPSQIAATSQFLFNRGPGAFRGIPNAASQLNAGNFYYDPLTGNVKIV